MDDTKRAREDFKNLSFIGKLEHIWYYYKWFILFSLAALIFALICFAQCATRKNPDAMLMYAGPQPVSSRYYGYIDKAFSEIMGDDYNGDGEKSADMLKITLSAEEAETQAQLVTQAMQHQPTNEQRIYIELTTGTSVIYLLDEGIYPYIRNILGSDENGDFKNFLVPLEESLGYIPDGAYDEYGIKLCELEAYQNTDLGFLPSDAILCIRNKRSGSVAGNDSEKYYNANLQFFRDIANWTKTTE